MAHYGILEGNQKADRLGLGMLFAFMVLPVIQLCTLSAGFNSAEGALFVCLCVGFYLISILFFSMAPTAPWL